MTSPTQPSSGASAPYGPYALNQAVQPPRSTAQAAASDLQSQQEVHPAWPIAPTKELPGACREPLDQKIALPPNPDPAASPISAEASFLPTQGRLELDCFATNRVLRLVHSISEQSSFYRTLLGLAYNPPDYLPWCRGLSLEEKITALLRMESRKLAKRPVGEPFYDLARLFGASRPVTARDIQFLRDEDLLSLQDEAFFSIIDLLSLEQCVALLLSNRATPTRKLSLYYYSATLATAIGLRQADIWQEPIDERVRQLAKEFYQQAFPYEAREFLPLLQRPNFLKALQGASRTLTLDLQPYTNMDESLAQARLQAQNVLTNPFQDRGRWKQTTQSRLVEPQLESLSIEWIVESRQALVSLYYPEDRQLREPGTFVEEISCTGEHFCSPGRLVKEQMQAYCNWLNQQLEACRGGEECPIITAALAYMRFISIHPFIDGNARTARFIADSILRTFKLLPGIWQKETMSVFPFGSDPVVTPTIAVLNMLEALKRAYTLAKSPNHP